jgi:hypothetical protein
MVAELKYIRMSVTLQNYIPKKLEAGYMLGMLAII